MNDCGTGDVVVVDVVVVDVFTDPERYWRWFRLGLSVCFRCVVSGPWFAWWVEDPVVDREVRASSRS